MTWYKLRANSYRMSFFNLELQGQLTGLAEILLGSGFGLQLW